MTTLFVSDLHLSAARPDKLELFLAFAACATGRASSIYILGDLFEVWLGDDDHSSPHQDVINALADLREAGVDVAFAQGNRDFLCGERFAERTGVRLLPDFETVDLHGRRALLTHGDLLCTRDVKYQRFRRVVRNRIVQKAFLATPLEWRQRIASGTQTRTRASMTRKAEHIMDVEPDAVTAALRAHDADLLIHGHTHRPATHELVVDDRPRQRIVLGDWYEQDDIVVCDANGITRQRVTEFVA